MTTERHMTTAEVAALFRVNPKTVTRWASDGRLESFRTPGGRLRFYAEQVQQLLDRQHGGGQ